MDEFMLPNSSHQVGSLKSHNLHASILLACKELSTILLPANSVRDWMNIMLFCLQLS